jgi:hypothetical protein
MKIILAAIFLFFIYAGPVYSLRLQDMDVYEEKGKIIEKVIPVREAREKNLHPFVRNAQDGAENPFDYTARADAAAGQETNVLNTKVAASDFKPSPGINFAFISIILAIFLLAHFFIRPKSK